MADFSYLWEFQVKPDCVEEFLQAYGADGDWVRLFSRDPDYVRTLLLRDAKDPCRFVTVDVWKSAASRDRFRFEHHADYRRLDRRCEALTTRERPLGDYWLS